VNEEQIRVHKDLLKADWQRLLEVDQAQIL
jgi:hypothetical protein